MDKNKNMKKEYIYFLACFLIGGCIGYFTKGKKRVVLSNMPVVEFVYKGETNEKIWFKESVDTLYDADNSVYAYEEGVISNPQCAAEVASALLDELYGSYTMRKEYPLKVTKDVKSWNVCGSIPAEYECGGYSFIQLYRQTGMVIDYTHY